jgi:hypothetical protein
MDHDGNFSRPTYLALIDLATGIAVPLPGGEGGNDAVYSPNGRFIAFDRSNVDDLHIYTVPAIVAGADPPCSRLSATTERTAPGPGFEFEARSAWRPCLRRNDFFKHLT